jgi:predicted phosphodiesterase
MECSEECNEEQNTNIHLVSDIHLELYVNKTVDLDYLDNLKDKVDILILAGDVGNPYKKEYEDLIIRCSKLFKHVIIVSGNHEYYDKRYNMYEIDNKIKQITQDFENVHFLQRNTIIINNIRFIGCTLWSLPKPNGQTLNDMTHIKYMSLATYKTLFMTDLKFLETELNNNNNNMRNIVITHHLPSYQLISKQYENHPSNSFFASDLEYLMQKTDMWLCGHTHTSVVKQINGCMCYINAKGYPFENKLDTLFDENLIIKL